jgi:hypothetical protein
MRSQHVQGGANQGTSATQHLTDLVRAYGSNAQFGEDQTQVGSKLLSHPEPYFRPGKQYVNALSFSFGVWVSDALQSRQQECPQVLTSHSKDVIVPTPHNL